MATTITTWAELDDIRNDLSGDYVLGNDLDQNSEGYNTYASSSANSGAGWDPIGDGTTPFTGSLDGDGFSIKDINIIRDTDYLGLFGAITGAALNNITIEDISITSNSASYIGSLVGSSPFSLSASTITNCHAVNPVFVLGGCNYIGGLIGEIEDHGIVTLCSATGVDIDWDEVNSSYFIGGLIGWATNNIQCTKSYATGTITAADDYIGGLIGFSSGNGTFENCWADVDITETSEFGDGVHIGGFMGEEQGAATISKCYSVGAVTAGAATDVGGFLGDGGYIVQSCFWDTQTSGQATSAGGTGKTTAEMKDIATYNYPDGGTNISQTSTTHTTQVQGGTAGSGEINQEKAQSFIATGDYIESVTVKITKTGTLTDNIIATITSSLGGSAIGSKSVAASSFSSGSFVKFIFDEPFAVTPTNTYYLQLSRSGSRDVTNYFSPSIAFTTDPYAGGYLHKKDNNTWADDSTTSDLTFTVTFAQPWDITDSLTTRTIWGILSTENDGYPFLQSTEPIVTKNDLTPSSFASQVLDQSKKRYMFSIKNNNGDSLRNTEIWDFDSIVREINGTMEVIISTDNTFDNFADGENELNNIIDIRVASSKLQSNEVVYFSGYVSQRSLRMSGSEERVVLRAFGHASKLYRAIWRDSTTIVHDYTAGALASNIAKDVIDDYRTMNPKARINYDASSVENTPTTVKDKYESVTYGQALDRVINLAYTADRLWFWRILADNVFTLRRASVSPDHLFMLGKDISSLTLQGDLINSANEVFVYYADTATRRYSNASSISDVGHISKFIREGNVTDTTTSDAIGNSQLEGLTPPILKLSITINDDYQNGIETINPGDTCKILNLPDSIANLLTSNMLITKTIYRKDEVDLELSIKHPLLESEQESLKRSLTEFANESIPTTYTDV